MLAQQHIETNHCLDPEDFADLDAGNLTEPELDRVIGHLSSCAKCETLLQQWQGSTDDELSDKVRKCFRLEPIRRDSALSLIEAAALDQTGPILVQQIQPVISDTASLSKSLIGARIGQYQILEEIGRGGMGLVFRAIHVKLNRHVAIKIIRAGFYADTHAIARFRTEAGAIARLTHSNVARIYDYSDQNDSLPYFVMELIDGGSLEKKLARGPLPFREAAELTQVVARAIEEAHRKQVIHRDLKPSNILMTRDGIPKIADFGLAKMLDEHQSHTQTDIILGTPSYMAPEQAAGRKYDFGPRTDVYSLGAILYETITGRPPFKGADRLDTLRHVLESDLTPPSRLRADVPRDLEAICVKCLTKSPSRRYQSAQAFADDLALWLGDQRPQGIPGVLGRSVARLRRNWMAASLGVVCLLVAVMLYLRDPDRPLREMQAKLAKGEPVTLIGEKGKPAWFKWLKGEPRSRIVLENDDLFRLDAFDTAVLELLPAVDCDRFRFQARVRHEKSNLHGGVGIFVARRSQLIDGEPLHFAIELNFNDVRGQRDIPIVVGKRPVSPLISLPTVTPRYFSKLTGASSVDVGLSGKAGPQFEPFGPENTDWRDLALIVTPQGITAEWEGKRFELSIAQISESFARERSYYQLHHPQHPWLKIEQLNFDPRGGLGLFVYGGSAAFCSASVIPLPPE